VARKFPALFDELASVDAEGHRCGSTGVTGCAPPALAQKRSSRRSPPPRRRRPSAFRHGRHCLADLRAGPRDAVRRRVLQARPTLFSSVARVAR
jgi:hypothetical protein